MRVCEREAMSGSVLKGYVFGLSDMPSWPHDTTYIAVQGYARMSKCIMGNVTYGPLTFA